VNNTLARSLVEQTRRGTSVLGSGSSVTSSSSLAEATHCSLEGRAGRLIALAGQLVRTVTLDLRLDIRHGALCLFVTGGRAG